MERWAIRPSKLFVLVSLLVLIALILVLPQVDLPDTAFHQGTAPLDVHSRVTSGPGLLSVSTLVSFTVSAHPASRLCEGSLVLARETSVFLPLLHRSLRC